jgi:hypothetical protein
VSIFCSKTDIEPPPPPAEIYIPPPPKTAWFSRNISDDKMPYIIVFRENIYWKLPNNIFPFTGIDYLYSLESEYRSQPSELVNNKIVGFEKKQRSVFYRVRYRIDLNEVCYGNLFSIAQQSSRNLLRPHHWIPYTGTGTTIYCVHEWQMVYGNKKRIPYCTVWDEILLLTVPSGQIGSAWEWYGINPFKRKTTAMCF